MHNNGAILKAILLEIKSAFNAGAMRVF